MPIGSGCCAQVYLGMLDIRQLSLKSRKSLEKRFRESVASGKSYGTRMQVAIKVLHPDIALNFARDLNVLKSVVSFVASLFPSLEWLSLKESIDEFAALMEIQVRFVILKRHTRHTRHTRHIYKKQHTGHL